MAIILLNQLGYVVLVLDKLTSLIEGKLFKALNLRVSQWNTLRGQELSQDVQVQWWEQTLKTARSEPARTEMSSFFYIYGGHFRPPTVPRSLQSSFS